MSTFVNQSHASEPEGPSVPVERRAFYLSSRNEPVFTWLHRADTTRQDRHGVVLCPPLGYEQIHSHRSMRHLADALARAGFVVLRLDYHSTGDSAGFDEDPDRLSTWLANIKDAAAWLRRRLRCQKMSFVGLRLGATLAMQAAAEEAVDALVLWAPVLKGRSYVREMKALGLAASAQPTLSPGDAGGDLEAGGFVLTRQTAEDLGRLDLSTCRPQVRRVLMIARDNSPIDPKVCEQLTNLGAHVELATVPGYADMMAEPHYTKVPHLAIGQIVSWMSAGTGGAFVPADESAAGSVTDRVDDPLPAGALMSPVPCCREKGTEPIAIRERIFPVTANPTLCAILTEPEAGVSDRLPLVLLTNGGSVHRVGPNRLYVLLARELACLGFSTLRLDLGGLGDSVATGAAAENDCYPESGFNDIELTFKEVQARLGTNRIVLMGLCSGAYFAFQVAAQSSNPALVESVMINPLTFFWRQGMLLDAPSVKEFSAYHYYMQAALEPKKWLKLLSGRTMIGFGGAIKMFWRRLRPRTDPLQTAVPGAAPNANPESSHPPREDVASDLERIHGAGRQAAFFIARGDPGYHLLMFHARGKVKQLLRKGKLDITFIAHADHTFSQRTARQTLVRAIADHLRLRYGIAS